MNNTHSCKYYIHVYIHVCSFHIHNACCSIAGMYIKYLVDEKILWLKVAMQHIVTVTKCKTTQQLVHKALKNCALIYHIRTNDSISKSKCKTFFCYRCRGESSLNLHKRRLGRFHHYNCQNTSSNPDRNIQRRE